MATVLACTPGQTDLSRRAAVNSTRDSSFVTALAQVFRECGWFDRRRVNQHLDALMQCLCPDLPHALQGCEQTRDTVPAFLTIETLVADDFECDGFEHS